MGLRVLSLFDGISCGMVALERAGIKVDKYYASEIDKSVIKISEENYPNIIRLGDVTKWREWNIDWSEIDLLIGGSPCQGFSFAGKQLNFNDERSKLFFEFVDILNFIKTKNKNVNFFLENVNMKIEYSDIISNLLGVKPLFANSRLVSAQDRKRLYWANFELILPNDLHITTEEIFGENIFAGAMRGRRIDEFGKRADYRTDIPIIQQIECRKDGKTNCVTTVSKDNVIVFSKQKFFNAMENRNLWRYMTSNEFEKLQNLPHDYTKIAGVSESSRKKAIGNCWTVDMIVQFFKTLA